MGWLGQNESMALTVYNYTDYLLEHQRADGFLGPAENPDPWPRMMIAYAFQQYSELNASDPRPVPALHRYFRFLWAQYNNATFRPEQWGWNYVRIVDMQTTVMWLYDNHATAEQQQFLLDLNEILYNKSADIKAYYRSAAFPHEDVANRGTMLTHGVNSAMAFKSAAVWYRQSADPDDIASTYERHAQMDQYHGQASGIFSCVSRTTTASTLTVPARSPPHRAQLDSVYRAAPPLDVPPCAFPSLLISRTSIWRARTRRAAQRCALWWRRCSRTAPCSACLETRSSPSARSASRTTHCRRR